MPVVSVKAKARIAAMFTGNHPSSAMFELATTLWGCRLLKNKQTIAIANVALIAAWALCNALDQSQSD